MKKRISISLIIVMLFSMIISTQTVWATSSFNQGNQYSMGAYDLNAAQPTSFNWTRQSRFTGSALGDLKWSYTTGNGIYSSPAIGADGTIYVGSTDGKLYAIESDGTLKWLFTGGSIYSSPGIGADGTIYVGSYGRLYAIKSDGSLKWSRTTGVANRSSPAIGADGTIYVGTYGGRLYAYESDGTLKWFTNHTGGSIYSSPAIGVDGTIYVGSSGKELNAIKSDGTIKWSYTTGNRIESSSAIGADGTIYVGSMDGKLYAIESDGTLKWSYTTGDQIYSSPVIGADGTIYVGSTDGKLYAIKSDGTLKGSYTTGNAIISSPAIGADGTIYVGSNDNKLYAIYSPAPGATTDSAISVTSTGAILKGKVNANNSNTAVTFEYGLDTNYGNTVTADESPVTGSSDTTVSKAITGLNPNTTYHYCVKGVNAGGTTTSIDQTFTTLSAASVPNIDSQPANATVNVGGTANVSIAASGGVALSYQWYSNTVNSTTGGAIISGAASSSYSASTDAQGTKYYFCVVTNTDSGATGNKTATATSNVVTVTVAPTHGEGGRSGSSSTPTSNTVIGSVIDGNGTQISNLTATVTTDSNGNYTVTMNAAQIVMLKQPDGTMTSLSDLSKVTFATAAGSIVTVSADGIINLTNMAKGTDNNFNIKYDLGNGQTITIGTIDVKISSSGEVSVTCTLIDPYGVIIDAATGKPVVGADVTLYYANTDRNKTNGKTPDTVVPLPSIDGFQPNNNKNPQISDASGAYGFMVFPTTDYYLVATKNGFNNYTSPTISVEQEIVRWDFKMNQTSSGVTRLAGLSSVDTALAIAKASYSGTLSNVVLATADNYPDALAGSVLAYKLNAPILLVGSSAADQEKVLDYMESNLDPTGKVYILGGTAVVSSAMESKVTASSFANITRLDGVDRYETSAKIAEQLKVKTGTPIVLAYGENYPDALSISSIAAEMQYPILLVQKDGLSDAVKNEIAAIKPTKIYIIGGEGVISATVESQVAQITSLDKAKIVRIAGTDRYETSIVVAQYFNLAGQSVCIATGNNFPDALAGSVYAANHNAPIILADGSISDQAMNYLKGKKLTGATLFGGEAVVSKNIEQQLGQLIGK